MKKLAYAGLTLAGFLLNFICVAICVCLCGLVAKYIEKWKILYVVVPMLVCAGIGAIYRIIRRAIRRMHMKTTVCSLICHGIPILCGVIGVAVGLSGKLEDPAATIFSAIGGLVVFAAAVFSGLFGTAFDKLFDRTPENHGSSGGI